MKQVLMVIGMVTAISFTGLAQKFGHIDSQEILLSMPERADAQTTIEARAAEYEAEISRMQQDLQTKFAEYQAKGETWPDASVSKKSGNCSRWTRGCKNLALRFRTSWHSWNSNF
jgi:Skp family chaperone for outer membrane proteins